MDVEKTFDKGTNTILGTRFKLVAPTAVRIHGAAIIDKASMAPNAPCTQVVRARGYYLWLTAATKVKMAPPLTSSQKLDTNCWIGRSGTSC